jgi:hypothetical protein
LVRNQLEAALVQHLLNEAPRLTAVNNVVAPAAEAEAPLAVRSSHHNTKP